MFVIKRNKNINDKTIRKEPVHFDKITRRIVPIINQVVTESP